jgi:hypothetical protein
MVTSSLKNGHFVFRRIGIGVELHVLKDNEGLPRNLHFVQLAFHDPSLNPDRFVRAAQSSPLHKTDPAATAVARKMARVERAVRRSGLVSSQFQPFRSDPIIG